MKLITQRLELILQTPAETLAWVTTLPPEVQIEISPVWLQRVQQAAHPAPWCCGFQIVRQVDQVAIGSCGFKAPPDEQGMVEIAYGIDEPLRNQGFATESAQALVAYAVQCADVQVVRAETKPDNLASQQVLLKLKFQYAGDFDVPEDGLVQRWELRVR
jgi:RimJ/RimL family protein N-acetyltransferase